MAARDVASESHTGTTGSQGEASFTWDHAGAASGVKGITVTVYNLTSADDFVTSVTCGGVDVPAVPGGFAADTAGEAGSTKVFHLGSGVPQGTNAIVVNRTNNAAVLYATAATVTGTNDTEVTGVALEQENQALAEENVDDGSPGTDSVRFASVYSGVANITSALVPGANSTLIGAIDVGANCAMSVWETTPGQGSRPVGCVAATDDVAAVYGAIREVAGGTNHTANPTDAEGLLDDVTRVADYTRPTTDPLGMVDDASRVADAVRSQTDALGMVDDVSYQLSSGTEQTFTDPLGMVDAATGVTDSVRAQTDPLGLLDSVVQAQDHIRTITDTLGLTDDGSWVAVGPDALGLTDSIEVVQSHVREITDDLGLSDSQEVLKTQERAITDPLGLLDSIVQAGEYLRLFTDPISLLDSITQALDALRPITDTLGMTDDITVDHTPGGEIGRSQTDTLNLSDNIVTLTTSDRTQTDAMGMTDSILVELIHNVTLTDVVGLLDSHSSSQASERTTTDALGLTDTATHTATYERDTTDPLSLLDDMLSGFALEAEITDLLGLIDDLSYLLAENTVFEQRAGRDHDARNRSYTSKNRDYR